MKYSTVILNGEKAVQGETNYSLADKVGFPHRKVSKVLRGDKEVTLSQIESVAKALGFETKIEFEKAEPALTT